MKITAHPPPAIYRSRHKTPLGSMILAATTQGLVGCWFEDDKHPPQWDAWPTPAQDSTGAAQRHMQAAAQHLDRYFKGENVDQWAKVLPVDWVHGTPFQQSVWKALLKIRHGHSLSYAEVAHQVGRPKAVRAVGSAIGRNPVSILVPCHRVLGSNGSLTGYAGGLHRKQALLKLEGVLA